MGAQLQKKGEDFFYEVRKNFNEGGSNSLELLFLNRCCYNGIMRFNSKGQFNVPFGHKPERFRRSYITKIVNQVSRIRRIIADKDWEFSVDDWRKTASYASSSDFVYLDPPYIGRHTDYYNNWKDEDAIELAEVSSKLDCGFALSMWKGNKYRQNIHIDLYWNRFITKTFSHFYHVGSKEEYRNEITEALVIKPENVAAPRDVKVAENRLFSVKQLEIFS